MVAPDATCISANLVNATLPAEVLADKSMNKLLAVATVVDLGVVYIKLPGSV